jgi:hypothetical protein
MGCPGDLFIKGIRGQINAAGPCHSPGFGINGNLLEFPLIFPGLEDALSHEMLQGDLTFGTIGELDP